VYASPKD